jgi:hypothetical protein
MKGTEVTANAPGTTGCVFRFPVRNHRPGLAKVARNRR